MKGVRNMSNTRRAAIAAGTALALAAGFGATKLISDGADEASALTTNEQAVALIDKGVAHLKATTITYPKWRDRVYPPGVRETTEWYLAFQAFEDAKAILQMEPPPTTSTGTTTTVPPTTTEPPPTTTTTPPTTTAPPPATVVVQPGQSWDAAFDAASPGDVIEIAGGAHGQQSLSGDRGGTVTIRAAAGAAVDLISLSAGAARRLVVEGVGTYGKTTMDVGQRPVVSSNVTFRNVKAKTLFIRTQDFQMFGGEIGGFNACAAENEEPVDYEDGIRIWNDGEANPSRRILIDGARIHDIRRGSCSDHADSIQIWSGTQVTLRNLMVDNCPTECLIARPVNGTSDTLRDLLIEGGHYGPVLDGTQALNIGSNMELCTNILVDGTTVQGAATFDCDAADGSWPRATVPDCTRFSGSVVCTVKE